MKTFDKTLATFSDVLIFDISDPSVPSGWSTDHVSQSSSSQMVSRSDSTSQVTEAEQIGVAPGDTLQSLLERLSLSSHLSLFQV